MEFNESGEDEHLHLSNSGDRVPSSKSSLGDIGEVEALTGQVSGESEAGTNNGPPSEGSHGNAPMLDLRVTEPGKGLIRTKLSQTKRIPNAAKFNRIGLRHDLCFRDTLVSRSCRGSGGGLCRSILGRGSIRAEPCGSRHKGGGGEGDRGS